MDDINNLKNINIFDKIGHKNWKIRIKGYEEAFDEMSKFSNGKDPLFSSYLGLMKNMVMDNNAVAQEKALEVVLYFVKEADIAWKAANDICSGIVNKCFNSTRQKTKELVFDILKTTIENEKQDIVLEELIKALNCKVPGVIISAILVLKESLHEFGPKVIPVKELLDPMSTLFGNRDKNVRVAVKEFVIEIYLWLGASVLSSFFLQLKPIQVSELNKELNKLSPQKIIPTRFLKSQKPKEKSLLSSLDQSNLKVSDNDDQYDLIEPVEIISKIPIDFYKKIEEKKWTHRKDALEVIDKLTNQVKLMHKGDYDDLVRALLNIIAEDCYIILVKLAGKCLTQIAKGLGKKYYPYALSTIQVCLEKFKEKNQKVIQVFRDCIDFSFASINLDTCLEDIIKALVHKSPNVRLETAKFLTRVFESSKKEIYTTKILKLLIPCLTNLCNDSNKDVRNSAFQSLGILMKAVSEKKLNPFLDALSDDKKVRIKEVYNNPILKSTEVNFVPNFSQAQNPDVFNKNENVTRKENEDFLNEKNINQNNYVKDINIEINNSGLITDNKSTISVIEENLTVQNKTPIKDNFSEKEITNPEINNTEKILTPEAQNLDLAENVDSTKVSKTTDETELSPNCLWNSKFYQASEMSEFPDQNLVDDNIELQKYYEQFEKWNENRECLMKNQIKRVISNIYNSNLMSSTYSLMSIKEMILNRNEILFQYGPFITVALCYQIHSVTQNFIIGDLIDLSNSEQNLIYNFWLLNQVIRCENLLNGFDDEMILIIMLVLLRIACCDALLKICDWENIRFFVVDLVLTIYKRTIQKSFTATAKMITIKILEPDYKEIDHLFELEIDGVLEKLYSQYIKNSAE